MGSPYVSMKVKDSVPGWAIMSQKEPREPRAISGLKFQVNGLS